VDDETSTSPDSPPPRRAPERSSFSIIWKSGTASTPCRRNSPAARRSTWRFARALANRPRIILADEPTAALDSHRSGIVMDLLRKVAVDQDAAIIAVTHDDKIFDRFDHIFQLRDGRLESEASVRLESAGSSRSTAGQMSPAVCDRE
jgi:ABC-type sugar transport system ATPase subunit